MKVRYTDTFERGQMWVKHLLFAAILCGAAAMLLVKSGSYAQLTLILISFGLLIGMVVTAWRLCRCPYCGKHIIAGVLAVKTCPSCRRSLSTGKKVKKSK